MRGARAKAAHHMSQQVNQEPHILVVDDHRDIRDLLAKYLAKHGFRVLAAADAAEARRVLQAHAFDLVLLDIMMPGEDGLSLCRHLRESTEIPVLLLTAMGDETDRIVGLEIGADDYVTKPFNPRELLARIKAILRRVHALPPTRQPDLGERYRFGPWTLDVDRRELASENGALTNLSTSEFQLLLALIQRPNMVLSRDQLLDLTKGRATQLFDRSIDNQISRLRKKIETDPKAPTLIQTVWGGGYKLSGEVERL